MRRFKFLNMYHLRYVTVILECFRQPFSRGQSTTSKSNLNSSHRSPHYCNEKHEELLNFRAHRLSS
jgi:hypothetical protein